MSQKKIALFGGTFDPIHLGHTRVAEKAAQHINPHQLIFIPARRSPLKQNAPVAGDRERFKMIQLAIKNYQRFKVSDYELKKQKPSYTLHTVRAFKKMFGQNSAIYWLVGADTIKELHAWYKIEELIDECNISVMYRAGYPQPQFRKFKPIWGYQRVEKLKQNIVRTPLIDISSTKVRNRLAAGKDVSKMIHPAVEEFIKQRGLYNSNQ